MSSEAMTTTASRPFRAKRPANKNAALESASSSKKRKTSQVEWWKARSFTSTEGLERANVDSLFTATDALRGRVEAGETLSLCSNRVVALAFMEPSTRTQCSFAAAVQRLGGS